MSFRSAGSVAKNKKFYKGLLPSKDEKAQRSSNPQSRRGGAQPQPHSRKRAADGRFAAEQHQHQQLEDLEGYVEETVEGAAGDPGAAGDSGAALRDHTRQTRRDAKQSLAQSPQLTSAYLRDYADASAARQLLLQCQAAAITGLVEARGSECPECCEPCNLTHKVPVVVVTWEQPVIVAVPVLWCKRCCKFVSMQPTVVDCLPDTPTSWDLTKRAEGQMVLWWQATTLQQFSRLCYSSRHQSADAFAAAMLEVWRLNSVWPLSDSAAAAAPKLGRDKLRKRMRYALNAYYHLDGVVRDYPEGLEGWPAAGAANACPCCGDSAHAAACDRGLGAAAAAAAAAVPMTAAAPAAAVAEPAAAPAAAADVVAAGAEQGGDTGREGGGRDGGAGPLQGRGPGAAAAAAAVPMTAAAPAAVVAEPAAAPAATADVVAAGAEQGGDTSREGGGRDGGDGPLQGRGPGAAAAVAITITATASSAAFTVIATTASGAESMAAVAAGGDGRQEAGRAGNLGGEGGPSTAVRRADAGQQQGGDPAAPTPASAAARPVLMVRLIILPRRVAGGLLPLPGRWLSVEDVLAGPGCIHSLHFDGCFKLNLLSRGKFHCQLYKQWERRRYFLHNGAVNEVDGTWATDNGPSRCSTFHADRVLASENSKNLITGAGAVLCRHGMLMRLMNLFTGERHIYAIAAMYSFLRVGTAIQFWWYDIACRWSKSLAKWLAEPGRSTAVVALGCAVMCLIQPWHRYAHNFACQKEFGHTQQPGVGRGTGEPAEVFNSVVGPHGAVTRYMAPANREAHLEHVSRLYSDQVLLGLPARLWRARRKAALIAGTMRERIAQLEAALGGKKEEVLARIKQQIAQRTQRPEAPLPAEPLPARAQYVRSRAVVERLQRLDAVDAPGEVPLDLLYGGAGDLTLRQRPQVIKSMKEQAQRHEQEHPDWKLWAPSSQDFLAGLHAVAASDLQELYAEIEASVLDYYCLEQLMSSLQSRKKEQGLVKKEKDKAIAKIREAWDKAVRWSKWCLAHPVGGTPDADAVMQRITGQDGRGRGPDAVFSEVLRQDFPWGVCTTEGPSPRVEATLLRCMHELARCSEEELIIESEGECAVQYYRKRVECLKHHLQAAVADSSHALLLREHMSAHEAMLSAWEGFVGGDEPPVDRSYLDFQDD
ncbi:hypothetical protein CHLRE_02g141011v5 [Chlamydomonas reinhardtii]|uniref:CxC3 like cysteine cluster domain-containing protein n=1 Tax=Chlamydomonas reinhardtii TaxID=3055 RepID=A0A2K3E3L4_CHLRE|nr:uncharacterized protein CHLRE_02g141011v5 [Chlamydomonas reinhardtii]PNW87380.1 hypothetical protein CHLRE_02g141011v5 [Chlamydomonas reinhardtii]